MTIDDTSSGERAGLSRRALLGRAAAGGAVLWASPLITSTASAQAASTCVQAGTLNWGVGPFNSWAPGTTLANQPIGTTGVVATLSETLANVTSSSSGFFGTDDHDVTAAGGVNYLELAQTISSNNTSYNAAHRTVRIDFGTELTNVQFHIRDIDYTDGFFSGWDDRVSVTSDGSVTRTVTGDLQGPGTGLANNQAVWRTNSSNLPFPGDPGGRANFTISGSPTYLEIHYWNGPRRTASVIQQIWVSSITFGC